MIFNTFINPESDEELLKSLVSNINADQEELSKALDKAKLVQKEVQYKGKNGQIYTRKQWVSTSDVKDVKDTPVKHGDDKKSDTKNKDVDYKGETIKHVTRGDKTYYQIAGDRTLYSTVDEAKKEIDDNYHTVNTHINLPNAKVLPTKKDTKPAGTKLSSADAKAKTHAYTDKFANKTVKEKHKFMTVIKANGVTWAEKNKDGSEAKDCVQWMRACMAMSKHFREGGSFDENVKVDNSSDGV